MNLGNSLFHARKKSGLSQEVVAEKIGVSRQTISKWELAQSYPDFQRLVLLSDYFGMSLDALVKDVEVQDVRDKNLSEKQLNAIYNDISNAKSTIGTVINVLSVIGIVGIAMCIFTGVMWG